MVLEINRWVYRWKIRLEWTYWLVHTGSNPVASNDDSNDMIFNGLAVEMIENCLLIIVFEWQFRYHTSNHVFACHELRVYVLRVALEGGWIYDCRRYLPWTPFESLPSFVEQLLELFSRRSWYRGTSVTMVGAIEEEAVNTYFWERNPGMVDRPSSINERRLTPNDHESQPAVGMQTQEWRTVGCEETPDFNGVTPFIKPASVRFEHFLLIIRIHFFVVVNTVRLMLRPMLFLTFPGAVSSRSV